MEKEMVFSSAENALRVLELVQQLTRGPGEGLALLVHCAIEIHEAHGNKDESIGEILKGIAGSFTLATEGLDERLINLSTKSPSE